MIIDQHLYIECFSAQRGGDDTETQAFYLKSIMFSVEVNPIFIAKKSVFTYFFPLSNHNKSNHRCVLHTLTLKLMIKSRSALPEDQKTFILLHSRLWISLEITSILDDYANRCINVFWCFSGKNRNINFVCFPAGMKLEMPMMFKFRDICDHIQLCRQLR